MTYQDQEKGIQSGAPIEVFLFQGTFNTYRYTSYAEPVIIGGETYQPIAIKRDKLKVGTQSEDQLALELSLPFTDAMVQEYAYNQAPPSLTCEIIRVHETDTSDQITLWKGRVTSFTVEGSLAKIRVPSIFGYILQGSTPSPRYQAPCNHILYDTRCGVNEAAFREVQTVTSFLGNVIGVSGITQNPADLAAGMLRLDNGEARMITSVVGTSITVTYPFSNASIGQSVDIIQGCDHSFATCKAKFNNGARYGGCPLVPPKNPFTTKPGSVEPDPDRGIFGSLGALTGALGPLT